MLQTIELLGNFILYFLSLIAPVTGYLLSTHNDGILKLKTDTESEKNKTEKNIKDQLKKLGDENEPKPNEIRKNLGRLEKIKRGTRYRLFWLNPKLQFWNLFLPLILALILNKILLSLHLNILFLLMLFSLSYFIYSVVKVFNLIIEARKIQDDNKKEDTLKIIELLSKISDTINKSQQQLLEKVYLSINGSSIKDDNEVIVLKSQDKNDLNITINNHEMQMIKNVEVGFVFDSSFIIEKSRSYSLFVYEDGSQTLRYSSKQIQGNTNSVRGQLSITPLKTGKHTVKVFVKGENVLTCYRKVTLDVN
ncbi:MAG: hypothetical protein WDZ64_00760 [Parcubacteria group bacterium]